MDKTDIDKFWKNVKDMGQNKQRVNVLYLTTACNLRCGYCYEQKSRGKIANLSTVHIDQFLYEIKNREAGRVSTVVFMGGEPFLAYPMLCYALKKMAEADHRWGISITTNGTMMGEIESIIKLCKPNMSLTLEISYDGSGQDSRIYHNGLSSRDAVEKLLDSLKIPFAISYTIHKGNYKHLLPDIILLCEKYKPTKISLSPYCQELDEVTGDYKKFMAAFVPYAEYITKKYGIPICDQSCRICGKCDKSNFEGNAYMSPTTDLTYQDQKTEKVFDIF